MYVYVYESQSVRLLYIQIERVFFLISTLIWRSLRVLEAVLIVMVTTVCIFLSATLLGTCVHEKPSDNEEYLYPGLTVRLQSCLNLHVGWGWEEVPFSAYV